MNLPIVEYLTLDAGVDHSPNIAFSIHLSEWQRSRWIEKGGRRASSAVLPIPAEEPLTDQDLREELGIPPGAVVAGFHQRASEEIYSSIPLAAFSRVARGNRYFLVMGGASGYRKQAADLGHNVRFVDHSGEARRISAFLNTLDVFAHGRSDGETFGTVFAEAMMHGKPCLSHSSPIANGHVETIGPAGFVVDDSDEYARYLELLLADANLRRFLGESGRRRAQARYALEPCVRGLAEVYDTLMRGPRTKYVAARPGPPWQTQLRSIAASALPRPVKSAIKAAIRRI